MGGSTDEGEVWPQWTAIAPRRHPRSEMNATRLDKRGARGSTGKANDSDMALFVFALAFGLAMLSLFAVLAFANVVALGDVAPFFAVPVLLFIISGVLFLNWVDGEVDEAAVQEAAHRSSMRPATRSRTVLARFEPRPQVRKSGAAARR
jgi:hypothetical protein